MTRLEVIAAVSANGVIGNKGRIPWHIPQDLRNFRRITTGHAVVMGRKTWESLQAIKRAPLPNRTNIVVSSQMESSPDVTVVRSLAEARALGHPLLFVIGGAALYAEALPLADAVHLTRVLAVYPGDTFFPSWDAAGFELTEGFDVCNVRADQDFTYLHYVRLPSVYPWVLYSFRVCVPEGAPVPLTREEVLRQLKENPPNWNALGIPTFLARRALTSGTRSISVDGRAYIALVTGAYAMGKHPEDEVPDLPTRSAVHEELRQLGIDPHTLEERALTFVNEVKASLPNRPCKGEYRASEGTGQADEEGGAGA